MTQFTQAVAGERSQVTQLLPDNVEPHDYQAKPEDAQKLAQADVLVENGLNLESFLTDLVNNAGNKNLTVVDASEGIETDNPHVWLDPKAAVQQVENIRDALIAADPAGKDIYRANATAYIAQLQALDKEISAALVPYAGQTFVTYHDFAEPFADSYDLKVDYLVNLPEDNATPADVRRVIEAAQVSDLKTLLSEPYQQGDLLQTTAKDLGIAVSTFDPLETSGPEGQGRDYYLVVMRENLENLEAAFGKETP
ncbi:MAG: zinc ABC transporter substrate-binding protein [Phormidesmis sp.]